MSLVEVMLALIFACAICGGLYRVGWQARRHIEYARLAAEARSRAKEQLEELVSYRIADLAQPSFQLRSETNASIIGWEIVRTPSLNWHTLSSSNAYAELSVDVVFTSPLWNRSMTNTFTTLTSR